MKASPIRWDATADRLGVRVQAAFHSPRAIAGFPPVRRDLPMLIGRLPVQLSLSGESASLGAWRADPEALFELGDGLIVLSGSGHGPEHTSDLWTAQFSSREMWRALANAMAVSATLRRPAIAIARAAGAVYMLSPSADVVQRVVFATSSREGRMTLEQLELACDPARGQHVGR